MILFLVGLVICAAVATASTFHALTTPPRRTYASAVARGRPGDPGEIAPAEGGPMRFRDWDFDFDGATLKIWDIEGDSAQGPCFIMTHGWGDSRIGAISRMSALRELGSRFIAWDMRGHGESSGRCALGAIEQRDLRALIERVASEHPVVLMGWSLGAGVSIETATDSAVNIAAVIAEAPYRCPETPARNMLHTMGMPAGLNLTLSMKLLSVLHGSRFSKSHPQPFDRAIVSGNLNCPLLVLHGEHDSISPVKDGDAIARAAKNGRLVLLPESGHDGLWTNPLTRNVCVDAVRSTVAALSSCGASTIRQ